MNLPDISYHRYGLRLRGQTGGNARSGRRVLEGFLIRVDGGYGCVQPWPELGDGTLEEQWQAMVSGRRTPLIERALVCAAADGGARQAGRSFFEGLRVPQSHATVTGEADFAAMRGEGFSTVKLKGSRDWMEVIGRMRRAVSAGLRVRVDFNGILTETDFLDFVRHAGDLRESVDFVEDPVPYDPEVWRKLREATGWPLALDWTAGTVEDGTFDVRVLKPAVDDPAAWQGQVGKVVITSYMDHPVGQAFAAWEAGRSGGEQGLAGLLTHRLMEPDAFTERLSGSGPEWSGPGGTGLGFDDLLEGLEWIPVAGRKTSGSGRVWQNPRDPLPGGGPELEAGEVGFATSGSTGVPSVVVHTEESLTVSAGAVNAWLGCRAEDVWLRVLPDFHVGGWQIHRRAALSGSRVVVGEGKWDPEVFVRICQDEAVTLVSLVPAQVVDLVRLGLKAPPGLRAVLTGGGALEMGIRQQARELGWPILISYGSSEAGSQVATQRPSGGAVSGGMEVLPHWEVRVVGGDGLVLPEGCEGLLELRGQALARRRYVWRDDGWEAAELADAKGWYRTSDRVVLSGRTLQFAGRVDRVVKVLGELVNLESVERQLMKAGLPAGEFVVVAVPEPRRGVELVLVRETSPSNPVPGLTAEDWAAVLQRYEATAAPFARLGGQVEVEQLPRSPLGKVRYAEVAALVIAERGVRG